MFCGAYESFQLSSPCNHQSLASSECAVDPIAGIKQQECGDITINKFSANLG